MLPATSDRLPGRCLLRGALLAIPLLLVLAPARADDVRTDSALAQVPADAAFFSSMLRNKEQVDILLKSKTYKKLLEIPAVEKAIAEAKENLKKNDQLAGFGKMLKSKENKEAAEVLTDAVSHEIFVYGGAAWSDLLTVLLKANNSSSMAPAEAALSGGDPNKAQMRAMLRSLQKNRELLKVPELVFGFKVSDAKKAEAQLGRLGDALEKMVPMIPQLKGKFAKGKDGLWTLSLDSTLIPWDDIPIKDIEEKEDEFKDLLATLKGLKASVSLGVKNSYILLAFTASPNDVAKIGKGKNLGEHKALEVLSKHAKKPIVSVGYISKAVRDAALTSSDTTETVAAVKRMLAKADLPAARTKAIEKDLDTLSDEMKTWIPRLGANVDVAYLTDTGYESFNYDQSDHSRAKDAKLHLLDHFGGDPILAAGVGFVVDGKG